MIEKCIRKNEINIQNNINFFLFNKLIILVYCPTTRGKHHSGAEFYHRDERSHVEDQYAQ
jgi:hypothetical protein